MGVCFNNTSDVAVMLEERLGPPPPLHELRLFRGSGGVVEFFCEASVVEMGLAGNVTLRNDQTADAAWIVTDIARCASNQIAVDIVKNTLRTVMMKCDTAT